MAPSYFILSLVLSISYAQNVSVDDTSSLWTYTPPVCADFCDGTQPGIPQSWWQLSNQRDASAMQGFYALTETATNLIGATASFSFTGTAIYYYGNLAPWGGIMAVTLDGITTNVSTITGLPERRQSLVYYQTGLDATILHQFTMEVVGGTFIDVDRVDITPPTSSSPPPPPSLPSSGPPASSLSSPSQTLPSSLFPPSLSPPSLSPPSLSPPPLSPPSSSLPSPPSPSPPSLSSSSVPGNEIGGKSNTKVIVGGTLGAAVLIGLCVLIGAWFIRRRSAAVQTVETVLVVDGRNNMNVASPTPLYQNHPYRQASPLLAPPPYSPYDAVQN